MDIDIRALKACAFAMSTEQTRYYLNGVCLEISDAGVLAIATDGHRLIAIAATEWAGVMNGYDAPGAREIIVPADTVKRIKMNKRITHGTLTQCGDEWRIDYCGDAFVFKPIEGSFPSWRRVLPKHSGIGAWAHFDPAYVFDFGKAAAVYGAKCGIIPNGDDPAWVGFGEDVPGFGVLMPTRHGIDKVFRPVWTAWNPPVETAEAA